MKIVTVGHTTNGTPITKLVESFWDKYVFTTFNAWLTIILVLVFVLFLLISALIFD
ncbi:hypothetical protein [Paraferrimonas sp. SM1919]|uniref:hypothetical protein n=1 Tax=Paraferrimonas sp. SM1919 TaxID=2662263 RepID=UPI0013D3D114|nr:hypothetical protein [Paraferrimonas sp. SM1919]